ncbi:hypothetical protein FACS1894208_07150 [Clostridia bacterium]|nr:hypothetical protein FACS1894208_07150 [Clostridia bacterium]
MDWTQIIVTILVVLFGSGGTIVTLIANGRSHDKKHDKTDGELEKLLAEIKQLKEGQTAIKEELRVNSYATKKQIKYTLTRLHRETTTRGYISRYELECAEDLYTEYKRLGGNSFIDKVMNEMRSLPIRFAEQEEQR